MSHAIAVPKPLEFSYDYPNDTLTIEGVPYSGELFRAWASDEGGLKLNEPFEIVKRENGTITFHTLHKDEFLYDESGFYVKHFDTSRGDHVYIPIKEGT